MVYKIGEFSRISMLSIKTLRYYHDIGILMPCKIDEQTGYRYYDEQAYDKAELIKLLKSFDFTIKEMSEILENVEDESDIQAYLLEKNDMIQDKINHYKSLQDKILLYQPYKEVSQMTQENVQRITETDQLIVSVTYCGKYRDVGEYISKLFKVAGMNVKGKPFCLYHDKEYKEDDATVEVCLPIKKEFVYKGFDVKILKGGQAVSLLHIGSYENLSTSYKKLTDYLIQNELEVTAPSREYYLKGPGMLLKGNPKKYQTKLVMMI